MSRTISAAVASLIATKGAVGSPRHLYRIQLDSGTLYYTDHEEDYTFDGQVYTSRAVKHSAIKSYMADRAEGCTVSIDNVDKAMSAYLEAEDFEGRRIEIDKVFLGLTASDDFIPLFRGDMDTPEDGEEWLTVKAVNINDRKETKSPWRRFGRRCNWDFCGAECGYNSGTKESGTADSGTASTLVDAALPTRANNYWAGATLRILSGMNKGESRIVSAYDDATKTLTVLTAFSNAINNTSEYIIECDKARTTCEGFSNEASFGGFEETLSGMLAWITTLFPTEEKTMPIVYGRARVEGVLLDAHNGLTTSDRIYGFCEGEISDIRGVWVNGVKLNTFAEYPGSTTQSFSFHGDTKYYRRTAVIQKELFYQSGAGSESAVWGALEWNEGYGAKVEAELDALKVQEYDDTGTPVGSPAWSDNPAWCILDFIMSRSAVKTPAADIDFASFDAAADVCTALGYRLNLNIKKQEKDHKILERMLTACRGYFTYHGGQVGFHVEKAESVALTFDDDVDAGNDNIKPGTFKPYKKHLDDIKNKVIVTYTDEQVREKTAVCDGTLLAAATSIPYKYNSVAFGSSGTVYINGEAITYTGNTDNGDGTGTLTGCSARSQDYPSGYPLYQGDQTFPELTAIYQDYGHQEKVGRVIEKKLDGTAIPTYRQASDIAEWYCRKAVEGNEFCQLTGLIDSLALTPGDVVNVTHERRGWTDRPFRVIEASEDMDEEIAYVLQLYDASFYPATDAIPPAPRESTLPNPYDAPAHVSNLAVAESSTVHEDGTVHAVITISFDEPTGDDYIFWRHALVVYSTDDWATQEIHGAFTNGDEVKPLEAKPGETYKIRAISVSRQDVAADSSTAPEASVTINGDTTAPSLPTGISAASVVAGIELAWTNPSEDDFQHVEVYRNTSDSFPGGSPLMTISGGPGKAMAIRDRNVSYGTTYYYWLKSVDTTGNASNQSASVNASPSQAATDDIANDAVTFPKVADNTIDLASDHFRETFEDTISDVQKRWGNYSGSGETSLQTGGDAGGQVLRVGDNSGNDQAWLIGVRSIPFDENRVYVVKARVRRTAGTGVIFVGVAGRNSDDTQFVNVSGANTYASQHYFAAFGAAPGSSWETFVGYFKGRAASGNGGLHDDPNDPGTVHTNVAYIRPLIILNNPGAAGTMEVDEISIQSYEVGSFGSLLVANAAIGTAAIDDLAVTTLKIADQAVTIPLSAFTGGTIACTQSVETTVQQVSITSTGAPIYIHASLGIDKISDVLLYRDTTLVWGMTCAAVPEHHGATAGWMPVSLDYAEQPGSGTYTYYLKVKPKNSNGVAVSRMLFVLETKK